MCPLYLSVDDGKMRMSAASLERHVRRCQLLSGRAPCHLDRWLPPLRCGREGEQTSGTTTYFPCVPFVAASFSHKAAKMRPGDSGSRFRRTPMPWDTALVMAASGGMTEVSPTPRTPYG